MLLTYWSVNRYLISHVCVRDTATRKEQSSPLEQGMLSYLECNNHRAIPGLWKYHMVSSIEDMTYMETCPQLYITMSLGTPLHSSEASKMRVSVRAHIHTHTLRLNGHTWHIRGMFKTEVSFSPVSCHREGSVYMTRA